jgi:hypothetical protein
MKYTQAITVILLGMAFIGGIVAWGMAGEAREPPIMTYQGQIRSVKIDRCGLQPGSCEGSILLAKRGGGEVMLAIKPGTSIRRGNHLVLIDELREGNYVTAHAAQLGPWKATVQRLYMRPD